MYIKNRAKQIEFSNLTSEDQLNTSDGLNWKFLPIYILLSIVAIFILFNLFKMQLIDGNDFLVKATYINRTEQKVVSPRGLIFDSSGQKLAYNIPSYTLYVDPAKIDEQIEQQIIIQLADALNLNSKKLWNSYKSEVFLANGKRNTSRITITSDISFDKYIDVLSIVDKYQGVNIEVEPVRNYVDSQYFAHILGYVGAPTQNDLEQGIYSKSQIGKSGIEKTYDQYLRGKDGLQIIETAVHDKKQNIFIPQQVEYGDNLYLTLDSKWQKKLYDVMQVQLQQTGAFASGGVIVNSDTGEVKAMVSLPSFDNNLFAKGISVNEFTKLIQNPKTPLLNRVIALQLPPGSIFKIIGATAGLQEKVITSEQQILSDRCLELPGDIKFCEADEGYLGYVDVTDALSKSSNIYFCNVALMLNSQRQGIRTLEKYAYDYGIAQLTGIDILGEQTGSMATPELKQKLWNVPWYLGDECNAIIGQGFVTVTPLQMTMAMSAINNGGKIIKPHLLARVESQTGQVIAQQQTEVVRQLDVDQQVFNTIKQAMREGATTGTASLLADVPGEIIAKTGSSDAGEYIQGKYYDGAHSWLMGCFKHQGSNYCFTIMQQWAGRGYKTVPIMKKFISCVYSDFNSNCENI